MLKSAGAFAQVGHGGATASASMYGAIGLLAGGDIELRGLNPSVGSYAKIGHGDDLRGSFATLGGTGNRGGDITVAAGSNITLFTGMIGHANSVSGANRTSGLTQVGVSRDDPTDPNGGNLVADAESEFSGEELRFYLPTRENNHLEAGVMLNGEAYEGSAAPWELQQEDEYTIFFIDLDGNITEVGEHDNSFGFPLSPTTSSRFAFYYDTISITQSVPAIPATGPMPDQESASPSLSSGLKGLNYFLMFPDDWTWDEWLRKQGAFFNRPGSFLIYYRGYDHYGANGESIFDMLSTNRLDSGGWSIGDL